MLVQRFLPSFACLVLAASAATIHAQQAVTDSDGVLLSDSHSKLRIVVQNDSTLRLHKNLPDGTAVPPFLKSTSAIYDVNQGYDAQGSPVVSLTVVQNAGTGNTRAAARFLVQNGHIHRYDKQGVEIVARHVPGVQDPTQQEVLALLQLAVPTSVADPTKMTARFQAQATQVDPQTTVLETPVTNGKKSRLTFKRNIAGKWDLTQRESFQDDVYMSSHTTISTATLSSFVNQQQEQARRALLPMLAGKIDTMRGSAAANLALSTRLLASPTSGTSENQAALSPFGNPTTSHQGGANGANVAFLHGFLSDGGTWSKMQPWLSSDFNFPLAVRPSVGNGGKERLKDWGPEVVNQIAPPGFPLSSPYIAIGHSAGGLVARDVAQSGPSPIGSVITIDTPHQGSDLLTNLQFDAVNQYINKLINDSCYLDYGLCLTWSGIGSALLAGGSTLGFAAYAPASIDLEARSSYTKNLNNFTETFPRYGLVGMSDQNWISFRTLADAGAPDPGSGQDAAAIAQDIDNSLTGLGSFFDAWYWYWYWQWEWNGEDPNDPALGYAQYFWRLEQDTFTVQYYLEAFDSFYRQAATCDPVSAICDDSSDGVVQRSSQEYPNAPNLYMTNFDGSHLTATKSEVTRYYLDQILSQQMFAPPQVCTVSAQSVDYPGSTSLNLPFQGKLLTFSVQTGAGCPWSATSSSSWLTFHGASSGTGSSTIQVLADYNNSNTNTPSGSVTIGGTTFNLSENSLPIGFLQGGVTIRPVIRLHPMSIVCGPIALAQAGSSGASSNLTCSGPPVTPPQPPVGEALQVTIGGVTSTVTNPTTDTINDAVLAAALINGDPSSPVIAGVVASTSTLWFADKQPNSPAAYSAQVTVSSGSPDIWVLPLGTALQ